MTQERNTMGERVGGDFAVAIGGLRIIPVKPDHEHAPLPGQAKIDVGLGVCYVLENEWPALRSMLLQKTTAGRPEYGGSCADMHKNIQLGNRRSYKP